MRCPKCNGKTRVIDVRTKKGNFRWRRRLCKKCNYRFSTMEIIKEFKRGRKNDTKV